MVTFLLGEPPVGAVPRDVAGDSHESRLTVTVTLVDAARPRLSFAVSVIVCVPMGSSPVNLSPDPIAVQPTGQTSDAPLSVPSSGPLA